MSSLPRLKKRRDFVKVSKEGACAFSSTLVVQCLFKDFPSSHNLNVRIGFTASKRVGNAVRRNKAKRRMREVAHLWIQEGGELPSCYLVMIAKASLPTATFKKIQDDFKKSLVKLKGLA